MITEDDHAKIIGICMGFVEAVREHTGTGAPNERVVEVMREAIALLLAADMFAVEHRMHLGALTEIRRITDRAMAKFEQRRQAAAEECLRGGPRP